MPCLKRLTAQRLSTGQDKVNPGHSFYSAEMMLRHLGWNEAADLVIDGMNGAIQAKTVTYDFARLTDNATEVSCSAFSMPSLTTCKRTPL